MDKNMTRKERSERAKNSIYGAKETFDMDFVQVLCGVFYVARDLNWRDFTRISKELGVKINFLLNFASGKAKWERAVDEVKYAIVHSQKVQDEMLCFFSDMYLAGEINAKGAKSYLTAAGFEIADTFDELSHDDQREMFEHFSTVVHKNMDNAKLVFCEDGV